MNSGCTHEVDNLSGSPPFHHFVFKGQEPWPGGKEMVLLFCLLRSCFFSSWQRFCPEADAKNMLQCLKQNKNSEVMDPKCKQMITKRQITQNTGERKLLGVLHASMWHITRPHWRFLLFVQRLSWTVTLALWHKWICPPHRRIMYPALVRCFSLWHWLKQTGVLLRNLGYPLTPKSLKSPSGGIEHWEQLPEGEGQEILHNHAPDI